jgi:hypothetical protein
MVPADWVDDELPRLNLAILHGNAPPALLAEQVGEVLLPRLPSVGQLNPEQAKRLVVRLGFVGASVARHYQEWIPGGKANPERAFDGLIADQRPFGEYFADLAERTGEGHYGRDSFASLVRWNVGTLEVRRGDELMAVLPGAFDDGRIRTYTGTAGEERFFLLVKQGEAIELAINDVLEPLSSASLLTDDAVVRVRVATDLIEAMRRLFIDFATLPAEQTMPPGHFLDVFRQFAVHWTRDDIPPSGALDPEAADPAGAAARRARPRPGRAAHRADRRVALPDRPASGPRRLARAARRPCPRGRRASDAQQEIPVQAAAPARRGGRGGPAPGVEPGRHDGHERDVPGAAHPGPAATRACSAAIRTIANHRKTRRNGGTVGRVGRSRAGGVTFT